MIKYVYCLRKRADLTDEEFHTYWKENLYSRFSKNSTGEKVHSEPQTRHTAQR